MLLKADVVFDTGVHCLLAEYHNVLWEEYDLFYVDCSYGQDIPSYDLTKAHLKTYVEKNLEHDMEGWLSLKYEGAEMGEVLLATDWQGTDFYFQAASAAKESVGISYIEKMLGWLEQTEKTYAIRSDVMKERADVTTALEEANGTEVEVKAAVWGKDKDGNSVLLEEAEYETIQIENPLEQILSANVLLRQVVDDYERVSERGVDISVLASHRSLAEGNTIERNETEGLWNKVLFCKYALDHFNSFTDDVDVGQERLKCELEYLLGGKNSDGKNLEIVAAELLAFREIDNYLCLMQDAARQTEAHSIATLAASLAPWLEPVVYQATMLYWAYEDSVKDLQTLFQGGRIPLIKSLPLEEITGFTLDYEEYLIILLMLQGREKLSMRAMDLIELSVRTEESAFRMDACISEATLMGCFMDNYEKKYTVTKKFRYY